MSPTLTRRIVDTTGAGDCWDAGFIAGLANGLTLEDSVKTGAVAAAFCIESIGGCSGVPSWSEVLIRAGLGTC